MLQFPWEIFITKDTVSLKPVRFLGNTVGGNWIAVKYTHNKS